MEKGEIDRKGGGRSRPTVGEEQEANQLNKRMQAELHCLTQGTCDHEGEGRRNGGKERSRRFRRRGKGRREKGRR